MLKDFKIDVNLDSERHIVELILHSTVKAFADAVALRMTHLNLAMLYAFYLQVEFILGLFLLPIVFCSSVCEWAKQRDLNLIKERDNEVI